MSPFLVKIYGFLVVVTLLISNSLFHQKKLSEQSAVEETTVATTSPALSQEVMPSIESAKTVPSSTQIKTTAVQTIEPADDYEIGRRRLNPCVTPIMYTLGTFDTRFGISKNYFLEAVHDGGELWSKAHGKELFTYTNTPGANVLTVNLVYDERQASTDQNKLLASEIRNTEDATDAYEKEYKEMQDAFTIAKNEYTLGVENLNLRQKKYNETVVMWNEKGGAPRAEFEALGLEKIELQKTIDELNEKHTKLTTMLADINAKIARHNELVTYANEKIKTNNVLAHKKFTEGEYVTGTNSITIYQFSDDMKLRRVLAHELGHTLGIDHTKSKQSIMYAVNTGTNMTLSDEDIAALATVCTK